MAGLLHGSYPQGFTGIPHSLRRIGYRSDHGQDSVSWLSMWVIALSRHSLFVCNVRLTHNLLSQIGIMACSTHTASPPQDHMPNVPAISMRAKSPIYQGADDAFPKAFHAFSFPFPKNATTFARRREVPTHLSK